MFQRLIGLLLLVILAAVTLRDWFGTPLAAETAAFCLVVVVAIVTPSARWDRKIFVAVGVAVAGAAFLMRGDAFALIMEALGRAAFIAAFFTALTSLRYPAMQSHSILKAGETLAKQPPGRRYAALASGGHLFSLILNYGSMQLLGSMSEAINAREKNEDIRKLRNRRMLLAIQHGFCASIIWSPLGFAIAITTSIVAGASWAAMVPIALACSVVMMAIGWTLDTLTKTSIPSHLVPKAERHGRFADMKPIFVLLLVIFVGVGLIEVATGLRIPSIVLIYVPFVSAVWIWIESKGSENRTRSTLRDLWTIVTQELPGFLPELLLLIMAGFIGTLGAELVDPLIEETGFSFAALPVWVVIIVPIWIISLLGQLGMNPILSASLFVPLLPAPDAMGIPPALLVTAITIGWSLGGATSPFTASAMLIGRLGHVPPGTVGRVWNGPFFLANALFFSIVFGVLAVTLSG